MQFIKESVGELRSRLGSKTASKGRAPRPLSRFELAKMVGVTEQTIKNWELGRGCTRLEHIDKLEEICMERHLDDGPSFFVSRRSASFEPVPLYASPMADSQPEFGQQSG